MDSGHVQEIYYVCMYRDLVVFGVWLAHLFAVTQIDEGTTKGNEMRKMCFVVRLCSVHVYQ